MEYLKFIFSGFWIFLGILILLVTILNFVVICWNSFWKYITSGMRKRNTKNDDLINID
jgi:F0F1-type ATP synthase membrane subunit b/b'